MLPPLTIRIGADTIDLERSFEGVAAGLNRLEGATTRAGRNIQRFGERTQALGRRMMPVSAAVSATAGAMLGLAVNTANAGNEIDKAARAAGMAPGPFQELRFAIGQLTDLTQDEFALAMRTLNTRMGEAASGNDRYADALERVGISMEDIQSGAVSTDQAFEALIASLGETESAAEAAGLASDLLGSRVGARLGPALREGAADMQSLREEAGSLGLVLSDDVIRASAEASDQMSRIRQQFGAASNVIGAAMLPVLMSLGDFLETTIIPGLIRLAEGVASAVEWFGNLPEPVQQAAGLIAAAIGVGGPVLMAVGAMTAAFGALIAATGPVGLFIAAAAAAYAAWQIWGDDIMRVISNVSDWFQQHFSGIIEVGQIMADALIGQAQAIIDLFRALFTGDLRGIMGALVEIFTTPLRILAGLWNSEFAEPMREAVGDAANWVRGSFNELVEWFSALPARFMQFGRDIITGLWDGLRAAWDEFSITDTIRGWGGGIRDGFADMLGIRSPSQVFYDFGINIGEGLAGGIRDGMGMARQAMSAGATALTTDAAGMVSSVLGSLGQLFQGSKTIAIAQALINTFQGITEALKLPFPASLAAAAQVAATGFAQVAAIRSTNPGGGGSGGAVGAGGDTGQGQGQATRISVNLVGDTFSRQSVEDLLGQFQGAIDRGGRVVMS